MKRTDPIRPLKPSTPPLMQAVRSAPRRITYTLRYDEDALGVAKRVEFEAESAACALEIARGEAAGRRALLLENGRPLCRLTKAFPGEAPYWILAGEPDANKL